MILWGFIHPDSLLIKPNLVHSVNELILIRNLEQGLAHGATWVLGGFDKQKFISPAVYYCVNIILHLFIHSPTDEKIRLFAFCPDYKQCCYGHSSLCLLVHMCESVSVSIEYTSRIGAAVLLRMPSCNMASYCQRMCYCVPNPHQHLLRSDLLIFSPNLMGL